MLTPQQLVVRAKQFNRRIGAEVIASVLERPIVIVSAPRSGSTLLFELLRQQAGFWSIGGESHKCFNSMPHLRFENDQLSSAALNATHADQQTQELFRAELLFLARDHNQSRFIGIPKENRPQSITLLEKTPRNSLNIPFMNALFPNAQFIYLHRDAPGNIASIMNAWKEGHESGRFSTYPKLPGWGYKPWCLVLPPGWKELNGKSVAEIAAFQWKACNQIIMDDLSRLDSSRRIIVSYDKLITDPKNTIESLCRFAGLTDLENGLEADELPHSRSTLTPPKSEKWKEYEAEITQILPELSMIEEKIARYK